MTVPLLIGGATTSKAHTAARIAPAYDHAVVYVTDASRAAGVCANLMSAERRDGFVAEVQRDYANVRARVAKGRSNRPLSSFADAKRRARAWGPEGYQPPKPTFLGVRAFQNFPIAELVPYIDWTPFFRTWNLAGRYPAILEDAVVGAAAREVYDDARQTLREAHRGTVLAAHGVVGFWPVNRQSEDIGVWADEQRRDALAMLHHLRQQHANRPLNLSLADYVAPPGHADYLGGFAVSVRSEDAPAEDDYRNIMLKALADRLVEAFAEALHARVRKTLWGYAPDEDLDTEGLLRERYRGIRPAPGYPACPDLSEKATLFQLLDATRHTGAAITENYAMWPAATIAGWYFSHPEAKYFGVGKIGDDQLADYAARKGVPPAEAARWLSFSRPDQD